jgi:hypothetical protein
MNESRRTAGAGGARVAAPARGAAPAGAPAADPLVANNPYAVRISRLVAELPPDAQPADLRDPLGRRGHAGRRHDPCLRRFSLPAGRAARACPHALRSLFKIAWPPGVGQYAGIAGVLCDVADFWAGTGAAAAARLAALGVRGGAGAAGDFRFLVLRARAANLEELGRHEVAAEVEAEALTVRPDALRNHPRQPLPRF